MLRLLNRRARWAAEIGHLKKSAGHGIYVPHREETILRRLTRENRGPLSDKAVRTLFREIVSICRRSESEMRVVYFPGTNSSLDRLARIGFGSAAECVRMQSIPEVFRAVEKGAAQAGIVPIENSDEGSSSDTLDLFIQSDLRICAEWLGTATYLLCARWPLAKVRCLWAQAEALAATRKWIRVILPGATFRKASSLAEAVQHASHDKATGLVVDIQDEIPLALRMRAGAFHESQTQYWILGKTPTLPTGRDKTSVMFVLPNKVGALQKAVRILSRARLNITRIESRPSPHRNREFNFFVDIEGHLKERRVNGALAELSRATSSLKVLGSYPVIGAS